MRPAVAPIQAAIIMYKLCNIYVHITNWQNESSEAEPGGNPLSMLPTHSSMMVSLH